ncbi:MauE/DoxX family redox-associated membrane protein [Actinoplanes flavus]|uniref:Methylamine utilisation protein MauE domain-containing protein n=1 Tax=Actinoplanes flavus TaxID=2820290 RepID=A0ABS3USC5_9ACTN|nr:MauE/DoxX family redox-associated membrane protein [Actinoplanes flavus]MBO3741484.1 hypothetical protein [Actinoplanes flavus]
MPPLLDAAVRFVAAAVLLYSAGQKLVAPKVMRQTLQGLRLPAPGVLNFVLIAVELTTAILLLTAPRSLVTTAMVVGLGSSFAGAALLAMTRGEVVRCACLGRGTESNLGWMQIALLPVWLSVAWVARSGTSDDFVGAAWVAVVAVSLSLAVIAFQLRPLALRNWSYLKMLESQWDSSGSSSRP